MGKSKKPRKSRPEAPQAEQVELVRADTPTRAPTARGPILAPLFEALRNAVGALIDIADNTADAIMKRVKS